MKAFCTQTLLGKSINEITEMMSKNTQLKIYKQQNNAYQFLNEMIIFPNKSNMDAAICRLDIKANKVAGVEYSPASSES